METKEKEIDEYYDKSHKNADEMYCYSCGRIVKRQAASCPSCGVILNYPYFYLKLAMAKTPREKETAMFLAFFASFFTWLYLYDRNFIKFWAGLLVSAISALSASVLFAKTTTYWYLTLIPAVLVWLFAVIDVSGRDRVYYDSYTVISKSGE